MYIKAFWRLFKIFFQSEHKVYAYLVGISLCLMSLGMVGLSYEFLEWYGRFYDALETKNYDIFLHELLVFGGLAGISILLYTATKYIGQMYALKWRKVLTFHLIGKWDFEIEGGPQRIQEDSLKFTAKVESLLLGALDAIATICAFSPVLWSLNGVVFPDYPGLLWFLALAYSIGGLGLSFYIGRKLPKLEYSNQKAEARLRTALEYKEPMPSYFKAFADVFGRYKELYNQFKYFNLWQNVYYQLSIILPFLVVGWAYFGSIISLGVLMQIGRSFDKLQESMSYLISKWTEITELQSVILRLDEFLNKGESNVTK